MGANELSRTESTASLYDIDVVRTNLQRVYFEMFAFDSPQELLRAIDGMNVDVDALARCQDIRRRLADGWLYWFLFTKGFLQYREAQEIQEINVYYHYLVKYFLAQGHNPAMREHLENREIAVERVARRYRDFDILLESGGARVVGELDPIRVTVSNPPAPHPYSFYVEDEERTIVVRAIDGWHRMCAARLCGVDVLKCEVIDEDLGNKPINGAIDSLVVADGKLTASGWWVHPEQPIYNYEVRVGGATIASGTPVERPDIGAMYPTVPHAGRSGFAIECPWAESSYEGPALLVGLQDIIPVGVLPLTSGDNHPLEHDREPVSIGRESL